MSYMYVQDMIQQELPNANMCKKLNWISQVVWLFEYTGGENMIVSIQGLVKLPCYTKFWNRKY